MWSEKFRVRCAEKKEILEIKKSFVVKIDNFPNGEINVYYQYQGEPSKVCQIECFILQFEKPSITYWSRNFELKNERFETLAIFFELERTDCVRKFFEEYRDSESKYR